MNFFLFFLMKIFTKTGDKNRQKHTNSTNGRYNQAETALIVAPETQMKWKPITSTQQGSIN